MRVLWLFFMSCLQQLPTGPRGRQVKTYCASIDVNVNAESHEEAAAKALRLLRTADSVGIGVTEIDKNEDPVEDGVLVTVFPTYHDNTSRH